MNMTMNADGVHEQLVDRIDELEADKARLLDELERIQKDNDDLRSEVAAWRGA